MNKMPLLFVVFVVLCGFGPAKDVFIKDGASIQIEEPISFHRYWVLPLHFIRDPLSSSVWVGSVKTKIIENKVLLTAKLTMPSKNASHFENHLDLGYLTNGVYKIIYLNPDGSEIPLKEIVIDNKYTEEEKVIQRQNENFQKGIK